jgi:hypothetical protein
MEIYNTETMQALRDVELAIDEEVLARSGGRGVGSVSTGHARHRISNRENPFIGITTRLGTRRVRPIVLELILALGHYVDGVWSITHPGSPCPWASAEEKVWSSRVLAAIQEGKRDGHVIHPAGEGEVEFWEREVKFGLIDLDQTFGSVKGHRRGVHKALIKGEYGEVTRESVLGVDDEGGDLVRLLNDLEDVIW